MQKLHTQRRYVDGGSKNTWSYGDERYKEEMKPA
jgi:hypothetical protein